MQATFTALRATDPWNHRGCKAASVGGLFHFARREAVPDHAPAKVSNGLACRRTICGTLRTPSRRPGMPRGPETTGRLNAFQHDWLLIGCKRTVGPFHRRVVADYALEVGAARDGDNRDHSLSAFCAASCSIHDILLDFLTSNPKRELLFQSRA